GMAVSADLQNGFQVRLVFAASPNSFNPVRRQQMNRSETLLLGMAIGAGLTYILDPDRGSRRRALMRDKLIHAGHELEDTVTSNARHVRNRAHGLAHEARSALREDHVDDRVLEERVRS